jgi:uncharacterized protein (TIGR03067 family)
MVVALSIVFATDNSPTEAKKEMEALRGTWTIGSVQSQNGIGKEIFKEGSSFIIEAGKMTFKRPIGTNPGTLKINVASNPPALDFSAPFFRCNRGLGVLDSWMEIQGIYRLKGNTLTICMIFQCDADLFPKDRPTDFITRAGDKNQILLVLHRESAYSGTTVEKRSIVGCHCLLRCLR